MQEYPLVYILMTTFNRLELAKRTIESLKTYLAYPRLAWHISDDGSEPGHIDVLRETIGETELFSYTNAARSGVGRSKNLGLEHIFNHTPFVLMTEDDWELSRPLDIIPHVDLLQNREDIGMVRYGFLGGEMTAVWGDLNGPFSPYWKLVRDSGLYVYSGQVSLRHKRLYDAIGMHREKDSETGGWIEAGREELDMCYRFNKAEGNIPDIVWPGDLPANWGPFRNIGMEASTNAIIPEGS